MADTVISKEKVEVLQGILDKIKHDDKEIVGILVYHLQTEKIIASTYATLKARKIIAVRRKYAKLGDEAVAEGVYPAGRWNWGITSVARYKLFATRLVAGYVLAGEFMESKSPSTCVEDILAFSLMVN